MSFKLCSFLDLLLLSYHLASLLPFALFLFVRLDLLFLGSLTFVCVA
jgi:hypothetical protein